MSFDGTVTLGNLISVAAFLVASALAYAALRGRLDLVDQSVLAIEEAVKSIKETIKDIAGLDKRIAIIEERQSTTSQLLTQLTKDVGDLRRGDGYIQNRGRKGLDGEY